MTLWLKLSVIFSIYFTVVLTKSGELYLDSKGNYQNLLIHISNKVSESNEKLLEDIKFYISAASKALYTATKQMDKSVNGVKFENVYISVPNDWKINASTATWQQSFNANFKIVSSKENKKKDKPFTKQTNKCGQPGFYSKFTDKYFRTDTLTPDLGLKKGKEIMVEFVKLRYGVFSEVPYKNILYVDNGTQLIQGSCNHNIEWEVNNSEVKCSDKNTECKYKIKKNQKHTYSVMFDAETPSSQLFCNDHDRPHNSYAYNLQNINCKGQSITSVIMKHEDFKKKEKIKTSYKDPIFHIVRQEGRKIAFVLDASGSMYKEMKNIKTAIGSYIQNSVESEAHIGIVAFKKDATIISPLIAMNTETGRNSVISKLDGISSYGLTNIGKGLKMGAKVLLNNMTLKRRDYSYIILITDGKRFGDNIEDYRNASNIILKSGIIVNVIFIGKRSDSRLSKVVKRSRGKLFNTSKNNTVSRILKKIDLLNRFNRNNGASEKKRKTAEDITILSRSKRLKFNYIDEFDGKNTIITVNFTKKIKSKYIVQLMDPVGQIYNHESVQRRKKIDSYIFIIPGEAQRGKYLLDYRSKDGEIEPALKSVKFEASKVQSNCKLQTKNLIGRISETAIDQVNNNKDIIATIDLSKCGLTRFERVKVYIEIISPKGTKTIKVMKDDGLDSDKSPNDKIFTIKLSSKHFLEKGFYTFIGFVDIINLTNFETIQKLVDFQKFHVKDVESVK